MTRQVWMSFNPSDTPPGDYRGEVRVTAPNGVALVVPLTLKIYPLRCPGKKGLHLSGWSYTNMERFQGVTPTNREALVAHLSERGVDAPWATSAAMPDGEYDSEGRLAKPPDTGNFDAWVALWPQARRYFVYKAVGSTFSGSDAGTELFAVKVGNWARFWVSHMKTLKLEPSRLGVLLVDEPRTAEQFALITRWAKAIKFAAPEMVLWEDPQAEDAAMPEFLEMCEAVDVLCPLSTTFRPGAANPELQKVYLDARDRGKELWLYSAMGPARTFDPFSYYLLQAWLCFKIGAKGSAFWAFADSGRTEDGGALSCWNEYPASGAGPYCPVYIDGTSVTAAKYMEAIREGAQDYQYLVMLREAVRRFEGKGDGGPVVEKAEQLLEGACDRVLANERVRNYRWDEPKDRAIADRVRIEILEALVELGALRAE
jgi:hypothetical protein